MAEPSGFGRTEDAAFNGTVYSHTLPRPSHSSDSGTVRHAPSSSLPTTAPAAGDKRVVATPIPVTHQVTQV